MGVYGGIGGGAAEATCCSRFYVDSVGVHVALCEAKVNEDPAVYGGVEGEVCRLDVAVDVALGVEVGKGFQRL